MIKTTSFWLDDTNDIDVLTGETIQPGKDYHKMAATLRAVGNFVQIVTGKSIPVTYSTKDESYTDGKAVVLSGNIKAKDYDPTVGLALHEGSHCALTDFDILPKLMERNSNLIPRGFRQMILNKYFSNKPTEDQTWMVENYITSKVKQLLNIVEDRRIDNHIYKNAPGYRGYYQAMYDKYFNSPVIDKALQSPEMRKLDWESYMFRICNIVNPNRDINALPGLADIFRTIDLRNIGRLKSTRECLEIALEIFEKVEMELPKPGTCKTQPKNGKKGKKGPETGSCNGGSGKNAKTPKGKATDDGSKTIGGDVKIVKSSTQGGAKTPKNLKELTPAQKRGLINKIKAQTDFLNNNVKKSNVSKADKKKIKATQSSGSEFKNVGNGLSKNYYSNGNGTDCLIVRNITQSLIDTQIYETLGGDRYWREGTSPEVINNGIRLGTMLGRKLQVRNDENSLKYNRLRKGNIDKRMLASLGFGNEQVFQQVFVDRFNPVNVHLSVDASGSMGGTKWENAQTAVIAIAKAASMVGNLNVQISYRSTEKVGNKYVPAIFMAYDSRKDKISKIMKLFSNISCPGTTPEGLCFEAIQKEFIDGGNGVDSYFINFSDGEPYFESSDIVYYGDEAASHTKKQVQNMVARGIKVLSYFIGSGNYSRPENFKRMYGKDAEFIDTNKVAELAKSLNKKFATK